jgi:ABC-2 type transport system permease protein
LSKLFSTVSGTVAAGIVFVSAAIPVSFGLDAIRQLLFPGQIEGVLSPIVELIILGVMGVIFITGAYLMLRRMEWLARVEARLSLRWQ